MMYRLTDRIRFGKHGGKTIEDVVANDPTYIEWMLDTIDSVKLDDEAMERYEVSQRIRSKQPSNRLYYGDVKDFENAIELHALALESEAADMRRICEPDDDFPERLDAEAKATRQLLNEYHQRVTAVVKAAEQALIAEWLNGDNEKAKLLAEAASGGDWSLLAV